MRKQSLKDLQEASYQLLGYTKPAISKIKNYIFKNEEVSKEEYNNLVKNLDDKSKSLVDSLFYINTQEFKNKAFERAKKVHIYSKWYRINGWEKWYYKIIFKISNKYKILTEVFKYHCGLKFVSKESLDHLKNGKAITAGAYWGDSALVFAKIYNQITYAFEPNKDNFKELKDTISKNNISAKVIPINKGLSNKNEYLSFNNQGDGLGTRFILEENNSLEKLEVVSIDSFCKQNDIKDIKVIHLDIEGFEYSAIEGAKEIIIRDKPILLISIYHNKKDFFKIKPLIESWNLGYRFKIRKLGRIINEIMLICEPK